MLLDLLTREEMARPLQQQFEELQGLALETVPLAVSGKLSTLKV
jgi:hypothetical protein